MSKAYISLRCRFQEIQKPASGAREFLGTASLSEARETTSCVSRNRLIYTACIPNYQKRAQQDHIHVKGLCVTSRSGSSEPSFLESPLSWALEPGHGILMFILYYTILYHSLIYHTKLLEHTILYHTIRILMFMWCLGPPERPS